MKKLLAKSIMLIATIASTMICLTGQSQTVNVDSSYNLINNIHHDVRLTANFTLSDSQTFEYVDGPYRIKFECQDPAENITMTDSTIIGTASMFTSTGKLAHKVPFKLDRNSDNIVISYYHRINRMTAIYYLNKASSNLATRPSGRVAELS